MSWQWVHRDTVFAVHDKQLAVHGGLAGVRDIKAVESALDRAQDLAAYGKPPPDIADLAAVYICGIASNHGFNDGYKRTAWVIGRLFLAINNARLVFEVVDAINFMLAVAGGNMTTQQASDWLRQRLVA
jgi:death-on-curing protein